MNERFKEFFLEAFDKAKDIALDAKDEDYNSADVDIVDYAILGEKSFLHEINKKALRLKSLLLSGKKPANESIEDTCIDLINYAAFLYAFLRFKQEVHI